MVEAASVKRVQQTMTDTKLKKPFNICVAVEQNNGIANKGRLPWPKIEKDLQHYLLLTSKTNNPNKSVVNIKGRLTFENSVPSTELQRPRVLNVVISKTYKSCPEDAYKVVPNFEAALALMQSAPITEEVESIWVMGGEKIFEEAVQSPQCHRIYLTQIFQEYECDRFFPDFKSSANYKEIKDPDIDGSVQEENGIKFQFQVYERVTS